MSSDVIVGSIYWPITQPLKLLRSDNIPFPSSGLFTNSREVYCPHFIDENDSHVCMLKKGSDNKCGYKESGGAGCDYDDYHNLFLLLEKDLNNGNRDSLKQFDEILKPNPKTYSELYYSSNHTHFETTLNAFPQTDQSKLIGWDIFSSPLKDGVFFNIPPSYIKGAKQLRADGDLSSLVKNDIVYAKSELLRSEKIDDFKTFMDAFVLLVKKDKIEQLLPSDNIEKVDRQIDIVIPVQLSFFADKKIDAILALTIRTKKKDLLKNAKLVRQALGSLREVIYNQRQEFLEKWCMRLGERVDDIVQDNNPKNLDQAIMKAMRFALEAIFNMAQSLAVQDSDRNIEKIFESFNYEIDKKNPKQIFKRINDNYIKDLNNVGVDRKRYIINFCKKAEMYAEEFVASEGKLKGRLSAPTVRELKKISHTSNPVNARILIRGEPGGGKGATAEDFHLYCMKRIAEQINKGDNDYIEEVKKRLNTIFELPANYSTVEIGAGANLFFTQISNTGWWLWDESKNKIDLKTEKDELLRIQKEAIQNLEITTDAARDFFDKKDGAQPNLIEAFVSLLKQKILLENKSEKPDFSFNFIQVNCGILGGENSELAESIERLFGKFGKHDTAMPGLFQTCSYMGGTLFLDEIADAPLRVQDNLLRPLEEGTVSRPGWETFDEKVDNIRIVGATFKDLVKLAQQYQETLPSGDPKGFRQDLLTRLTRNPPVSVTPVWQYFVPTKQIDDDFPSQFAFVLNNSWLVSSEFWRKVYFMVSEQIDEHAHKARHHNPDELEGRRKIASKITMRLFKEVGKIAQLKDSTKKPKEIDAQRKSALDYLSRMLDYLLVETN